MKKVLCVFLIVAMLISVFAMSANAADKEFDASKFKYFEKTLELYGEKYRYDIEYSYNELYYHYSDENQGEPDWTLIFCVVRPDLVDVKYGTLVGNRVLAIDGGFCVRLQHGYGVYVKETDSIIELSQRNLNQIIELCPDFVEAIEENEIGRRIGDVNDNGQLDVMDATHIQRGVAGISNLIYIEWAYVNNEEDLLPFADFDGDGETTVMDATAIQRHIAGLE